MKGIYKTLFCLMVFLFAGNTIAKAQFPLMLSVGGRDPKKEYLATSIGLSSINATLSIFNVVNFRNENKPKSNGGFAVIMGFSQIIYAGLYSTENSNKGIDALNYSLGTTTMLIGIARMLSKSKTEKVTVLPMSYRVQNESFYGLTINVNLNKSLHL